MRVGRDEVCAWLADRYGVPAARMQGILAVYFQLREGDWLAFLQALREREAEREAERKEPSEDEGRVERLMAIAERLGQWKPEIWGKRGGRL